MSAILAVDMGLTLVEEVDASAYHSKANQARVGVSVFVLEGGTNHRDQFVVGFETELGIEEKDFELLLEFEK